MPTKIYILFFFSPSAIKVRRLSCECAVDLCQLVSIKATEKFGGSDALFQGHSSRFLINANNSTPWTSFTKFTQLFVNRARCRINTPPLLMGLFSKRGWVPGCRPLWLVFLFAAFKETDCLSAPIRTWSKESLTWKGEKCSKLGDEHPPILMHFSV